MDTAAGEETKAQKEVSPEATERTQGTQTTGEGMSPEATEGAGSPGEAGMTEKAQTVGEA